MGAFYFQDGTIIRGQNEISHPTNRFMEPINKVCYQSFVYFSHWIYYHWLFPSYYYKVLSIKCYEMFMLIAWDSSHWIFSISSVWKCRQYSVSWRCSILMTLKCHFILFNEVKMIHYHGLRISSDASCLPATLPQLFII